MHRKRTKFAARVHKVASALERRGVVATYELHDRLLGNRAARRRYTHEAPALDDVQQGIVERLRSDGYATLPLTDLLPGAWPELEQAAHRFVDETEAELARERSGGESALRRREGKEFVVRKYAYDVRLGLDDPWLKLGLEKRMLDVANTYLGMWTKLEYVDVWYTPPVENGDRLWPWRPLGDNYPPEDELDAKVAGRSVRFTAPKGTLIFCNTSGFHRGGFAVGK